MSDADAENDVRVIAHHEAGHTVAVIELYGAGSVERVWVSPAEEVKGSCKVRDGVSPRDMPTIRPVSWSGRSYSLPCAAWAEVVCAAGGVVAEVLAIGGSEGDLDFPIVAHGCGDAERAARCLREHGISNPVVFRTVFMPEVMMICRKCWSDVERVADALLANPAIACAHLDTILQRSAHERRP